MGYVSFMTHSGLRCTGQAWKYSYWWTGAPRFWSLNSCWFYCTFHCQPSPQSWACSSAVFHWKWLGGDTQSRILCGFGTRIYSMQWMISVYSTILSQARCMTLVWCWQGLFWDQWWRSFHPFPLSLPNSLWTDSCFVSFCLYFGDWDLMVVS